MLSLSTPLAQAARFVDTGNYWGEKYINKLSDKGIIAKAPDGKFRPKDPVARWELAEWLVKTLGLENQPVAPTSSFPDVKTSDPYFKAVEIIRQNNFISGYADGFRPKQFIQRGEMITIVSRALNAQKLDEAQVEAELARFSDRGKIPAWARQGIALASKEGILVTEFADRVDAAAIATRGEVAAVLCALFEIRQEEAVSEALHKAESVGHDRIGSGADSPGSGGTPYQGQVMREANIAGNMPYPPASFPYQQPPGYFPPGNPGSLYPISAQMGGGPPYPANGQVLAGGVATVAAGTTFAGTLKNSLDSGSTQPGESVELTLSQPLFANGQQVLPAGTVISGNVTSVISARRFKFGANGKLDIKFNQCATPDGRRFPLSASNDTNHLRLTGGTTAGRVGKGALTAAVGAGSGAALGTALGAIVGATSDGRVGKSTGMGAVFGTAIGGGVGLVGAGVRKGSEVRIPAGSNIPVTVDQTFQVTTGMPVMPYPPSLPANPNLNPNQYGSPNPYQAPPSTGGVYY
jgi:hypothetical protein